MTVKGNSHEGSEGEEESCKEGLNLFRGYLSGCDQNIGRNMDGKDHSNEVSVGNEECVTGNRRKGNPYYEVAKSLDELCSCPSFL